MPSLKTLLPLALAATATGTEFVGAAATIRDAESTAHKPFLDVRFGYGLAPAPSSYDITVTDSLALGGATREYVDGVDTSRAETFSFGLVGGSLDPYGLLLGGELVYGVASQRMDSRTINGAAVVVPIDSSSLQYRTFGGNVLAGIGYIVNPHVNIEALGVLGFGALDLDFANSQGSREGDGEGWYWNAGVRGGIYYTWERFVIGFVVDCTRTSITARREWVDATSSISQSFTGVGGRLEFGARIQ